MKARFGAAVLSGLLLALTSPPWGWAVLAWVLWVPMFWACRPGEGKRNAKIAYLAGIVSTAVIYEWLIGTIQIFGGLPSWVGLIVLLVFAAAFSLVYPLIFGTVHWFRTRLGDGWMLATPALWVSFEKLDPSLFPYYQGSTQYRTEATWQFASVLGPTGLTFLIVLCNCVLAEVFYRRWENRPTPKRALVATFVSIGLMVGWGSWRAQSVETELAQSEIIKIGLLQQNVTMDERIGAPFFLAMNDWMEQTQSVADSQPDLVIWAEGAIPYNASVNSEEVVRQNYLCGLTEQEYFEFLAGEGGASVLLTATQQVEESWLAGNGNLTEPSFCMQMWGPIRKKIFEKSKSAEEFDLNWTAYIDKRLEDLADDQSAILKPVCGFNMLIGAGTREGEKVFNTAFGLSRPSIDCRRCTGEACEGSDSDEKPARTAKESLLMILRCTGRMNPSSESVAACMAEQGMAMGSLDGGYDKMIPLPFGEYIPFSDTFPALRNSIQGVGDFRAGTEVTVFEGTTSAGVDYSYSAPICYEAILERQMWKMLRNDSGEPVDFFVNITNDAWYGVTAGPHQHAMLTAAQAVMFGRPLIRSAYTGISWVVEPHGQILNERGLYEESAEVIPMRLGSFDTLFVRGGWVFPYLCLLGTALAFFVGRRRGPNHDISHDSSHEPVTSSPLST